MGTQGAARRSHIVALLAVAGLVVAGCSDDDATPTATTAPTAESAPPEPDDDGIVDYLEFVGGDGGAAETDAEPIVIGWVNVQGGTNEFPEATQGAQAAVEFVNAELGGIDGRPLELRTCFIASAEEEGQRCGQELVDDNEVAVIAFGAMFVGNQSFHAVVDGEKPVVIGVASAPADSTADNTYALYGDQTHVLAPWGTFARDELGAETAAVVFPNQAGANTAAVAAQEGLEAAGIEVTAVGYDPQSTDLLGPLTAAGAQSADVVVPMTDVAGCVNLAKALDQIGSTTPVVSNPLCLSPVVAEGLGDLPVGWVFGIAQTLPSDASRAPDAAAYVEASSAHGLEEATTANPFAALAWAEVLTIARLMNAVGADAVTPEAIAEQLAAFDGPLVMGAPTVECGKYPDAPAVCNDQTRFYRYEGAGEFTALTGWLRPPS